jgi:hypothetical protein
VPSTIPIWFYATHDDSTTADLVVDGGTAKQYRALGSTDPQGTIADAMAGASITNAKSFPAGPLGGSMECGSTLSKSKKTLYLCVWQDDSMFVAVTVANVHTVEQAATITLDLRNAAEKP